LCWLCGQRLGTYLAFVIGPMCAINRISSEPPSHRDCAEFAAVACPFLARPQAQRRTANLDPNVEPAAGMPIKRNPGVALVWVTREYKIVSAPKAQGGSGWLWQVGRPTAVRWYAEGRTATRDEVMASITSGMPV